VPGGILERVVDEIATTWRRRSRSARTATPAVASTKFAFLERSDWSSRRASASPSRGGSAIERSFDAARLDLDAAASAAAREADDVLKERGPHLDDRRVFIVVNPVRSLLDCLLDLLYVTGVAEPVEDNCLSSCI
jgi:hypothetical protein